MKQKKKSSLHPDMLLGTMLGVFILILVSFLAVYSDSMRQQASAYACTQEARLCPNGSVSVRTGARCEFTPCTSPDLTQRPGIVDEPFIVPTPSSPETKQKTGDTGVACTQEVKLCPDGSSVGRSGPHCEFTLCPPGEDIGPAGR